MKNYRNIDRGQWAELKLHEVINKLPNKTVSDIGAGWGWFRQVVERFNLEWQPFDFVKKIEESTIWDLNNPAPENVKNCGFAVFMEVLEHLSNPELGIKNISKHIETGGYMVLTTPNPFSAESKFTILFKNCLYAFQNKHLREHHVYVPLPHVVKFHLENNNFEILEFAIIGDVVSPKVVFSPSYLSGLIHYLFLKLFVVFHPESKGHTQGFFVVKK